MTPSASRIIFFASRVEDCVGDAPLPRGQSSILGWRRGDFLARRPSAINYVALAMGLAHLLSAPALPAADWPQLLGPHRDGVAPQTTLPAQLPSDWQPRWSRAVGDGYAGPVVVGETVVVFHRVGNQERVEALARDTGMPRWQRNFAASYAGGVDTDLGPRCAPVVSGKHVVLFGAAGDLHCVHLNDGRVVWSRPLYRELGGQEGYFGAGSTPLIVGDLVIVNAGGRDGAGVVALALNTGQIRWQATDEAASYSSPVPLPSNESAPQVLLVARLNALRMDVKNGEVLARYPFGRRGPTVNAAVPLVFGETAFLTASYGVGASLLDLNDNQLRPIWNNDRTLSSQYNSPVYYDGYLFGIHGREDLGPASLRCVEAQTGRVMWEEAGFGVAHIIRAGDRLLLLKVDGTLVLARANANSYDELDRATVSPRTTRALPALADDQLVLRENHGNGDRLLSYSLVDPGGSTAK